MSGYVEIDVSFVPKDASDVDGFEALLDAVMDELEKIGVTADFTASLAPREATFLITTSERSDDEFIAALTNLRTALHAADCGTPDWPSRHEIQSARNVGAADLVSA